MQGSPQLEECEAGFEYVTDAVALSCLEAEVEGQRRVDSQLKSYVGINGAMSNKETVEEALRMLEQYAQPAPKKYRELKKLVKKLRVEWDFIQETARQI